LSPHTNYLAVGLFLLVGVAAVVLLVVSLGRAGDTTPTAQYVVQIHGDVNGLGEGSTVRYLGVGVGTVNSITLQRATTPFVEVMIEIEKDLPVDKTTYATLVSQGVTGIANVDLGSRSGRTEPLATHSSGMPVIPFRATGLSAMLAGSGDLTTNARQLLAQLNVWTGAENLQRVQSILENLDTATDAVAAGSDDIPELISSLKSTVANMELATDGFRSAIGDDWPVVARDLKTTSANLASVSGRVDDWLVDNDESVDQLLGEGLESMTGLVGDLREVADQLSRLGSKLSEDPSRLVYRGRHDPVVVDP